MSYWKYGTNYKTTCLKKGSVWAELVPGPTWTRLHTFTLGWPLNCEPALSRCCQRIHRTMTVIWTSSFTMGSLTIAMSQLFPDVVENSLSLLINSWQVTERDRRRLSIVTKLLFGPITKRFEKPIDKVWYDGPVLPNNHYASYCNCCADYSQSATQNNTRQVD